MQEIQHKTLRRTPAEKKTADEIDKLAAKATRDPEAERKAARLVAAAKRSPRYEFNRGYSVIDQAPILYFYHKGESITGIIGAAQPEDRMACTYPVKLEDGRIVRIVAHKRLRQAIDRGKYVGRNVRIEYQGKLLTGWGSHYEKLYEVSAAGEPPVTSRTATARKAEYDQAMRGKLRKDLQDSIAAGDTLGPRLLAPFAGEAWADTALAKAKESK